MRAVIVRYDGGKLFIRDHHESLTLAGETTWSISASLSDDLDALAGI